MSYYGNDPAVCIRRLILISFKSHVDDSCSGSCLIFQSIAFPLSIQPWCNSLTGAALFSNNLARIYVAISQSHAMNIKKSDCV